MSLCQYFYDDKLVATGIPEIKQWLFDGGLERLLPDESAPKLVGQSDNIRLAPNGKPSNLNALQYKQVRTPEFKAWFGDWENDPDNASKVVDENGEPLVVYHGSGSDFNEFMKEELGTLTMAKSAEKGFFFSDNPIVSESYTAASSEFGFITVFADKKQRDFQKDVFKTKNYLLGLKGVGNETLRGFPDWYGRDGWIDEIISKTKRYPSNNIEEITKILNNLFDKRIDVDTKELLKTQSEMKGYQEGGNIMPVFLNVRTPIAHDFKSQEYRDATFDDLLKKAIKSKKDGSVFSNVFDGGQNENREKIFSTVFVAFNPNQIKSATGNTGAFSSESNDIRFSKDNQRKADKDETSSLPGETAAQKAQRLAQDRFNRFDVIQQQLEIEQAQDNGYTGNDIHQARDYLKARNIKPIIRTGETDFYKAESTHAGAATAKIEDFKNLVMSPLIKEMGDARIRMGDVSNYLLMRYALTKPELGISDTVVNKALANYQARPDFAKLKSIADRWQDQTKSAQAQMEAAGMIPSTDALPIEIPPQKQGEADDVYARRLSKALRGQDAITSIIHDYEKAMNAIEKNKISVIAANLIKEANNPDIGILNPPKHAADGKFTYYVNGEKKTAQFNDELLAKAFKERGMESLGAILEVARETNGFLSKVYTAFSPTFLLKNPIRDAVQGMITNTSKLGMADAKDIFKAYPRAMKELYNHFKEYGSSAEVSQYRNYGGNTGAAYLSDTERLGNELMDSYNEYAGAIDTYNRTYQSAIKSGKTEARAKIVASSKAAKAGIRKTPIIGHFLNFMENANAITENALRLATFTTLVEKGHSPEDAAAYAKDLMNFNRKGELSTQAGALYLFYNPSAQGTQVMLSALKSSKYKNEARALTGMIALAAFFAAEAMRSGDDDDEEKWKMIPDSLKDRNLIFGSGDTVFMLPVPYGYGVFHSLGNAISDVMHGQNTYKASIRMASALADNFSPFGNPIDSTHDAFQLLPTIPKMVMSPSVNENNFGTPIQPVAFGNSNAKPDSANMYRNTKGTVYAAISEGLNELTGGNKYQAGAIDISPETLKFWTSSLTGGTGQFFADTLGLGNILAQGATPNLKDVPIAKAFAHEINVQDARQQFWKSLTEAQTATTEFAAAKKARDRPAMMQIRADNSDLLSLARVGNRYQKMASAIRNQIDSIRLDDSLSLDERRTKQKQLEQKEMAVYSRFLRLFNNKTKN